MLTSVVSFHGTHYASAAASLPTLVCGTVWAWLLRREPKEPDGLPRWNRLASVPLAAINAGLTAAVVSFSIGPGDLRSALLGAAMGATLGAVIWLPALTATLVCFGMPIRFAQRLARKGLAGEERGEWIVGLACFLVGALGLWISTQGNAHLGPGDRAAVWLPRLLALSGLLAGATSTVLARAREMRRRAFVVAAEAGRRPGYRIDATPEGKVLVRIVAQGKGYRVADFEEEVFELDAAGEAKRPKHAAARGPTGDD